MRFQDSLANSFSLFVSFDTSLVKQWVNPSLMGLWSAWRALGGGRSPYQSHTVHFTLTFSIWAWRALPAYAKYSAKGKRFKMEKGFVLCWFSCNQANQSPKCILDAAQRPHDTLSPNGYCSLREVMLVCSVKSEH